MNDRNGRADRLALGGLTVGIAALYLPELLGLQAFFFFDISSLNLPARDWAFRQIRAGYFPEWNPHWVCGFPFVAESQSGVYYPPNYLCFLSLPSWYATAVAYVVHLWWAGVGAYLVYRRGATALGAFVGAAAFAVGGRLIAHQIHAAVVETIAWFPWIVLGLLAYVETGNRRALWWTALAVGLQALAGSLQLTVCCHVGYAFVSFALAALEPANWRRSVIAQLGLVVALLGLAAPLWMPAAELLALSSRQAGGSSEWANFGTVFPHAWTRMLAPGMFGDPAYMTDWRSGFEPTYEMGVYHGALVPPLALLAVYVGWRRRWTLLLAGLAGLGLILALGEASVVGVLLRKLPVLGSIRVPARWLLFTGFGVCGLAACGWDALHRKSARRIVWPSFASFCVGCTCLVFWYLYRDVLFGRSGIDGKAFEFLLPGWSASVLPGTIGLIVGMALLSANAAWTRGAALTLLLIDLGWHARLAYPTIDPAFHAEPPSVAAIESLCGAEPPRVYVQWTPNSMALVNVGAPGWRRSMSRYTQIGECLYYERGPLFDVGLVVDEGKLPLEPQRLTEFRAAIPESDRLFALMGVPLKMTPRKPAGEVAYSGRGCYVERTPLPTAFAYFCGAWKDVPPGQALAELQRSTERPHRQVTIELEPHTARMPEPNAPFTPARSRWIGPNRFAVEVDAPTDGYLVVNEMNYPGWRAILNGLEVPILHANHLFMAIHVAKGAQRVEFEFRSPTVQRGRSVGAAALLVWSLLWMWTRGGTQLHPDDPEKPAVVIALPLLVVLFVGVLAVSIWLYPERWQSGFPTLRETLREAASAVPSR